MKRILTHGMLAATFCLLMAACNAPNNQETDSTEVAEEQNEAKLASDDQQDDAEFMVKAASGGLLEVELGRMVMQKASSQQVKDFGKMMVEDHTKSNQELKALAAQKNITIPTAVGEEHQEHINQLAGKSGTEFDEEYMQLMTKDHQEDIDHFSEAAQEAQDADIKAFAAKSLPVLRHHLQMAEQMEGMAKNNHRSGSSAAGQAKE